MNKNWLLASVIALGLFLLIYVSFFSIRKKQYWDIGTFGRKKIVKTYFGIEKVYYEELLTPKELMEIKIKFPETWFLMFDHIEGFLFNETYCLQSRDKNSNDCIHSLWTWLERKSVDEVPSSEEYKKSIEPFFRNFVNRLERQDKDEILKNTRYLSDENGRLASKAVKRHKEIESKTPESNKSNLPEK